ncbi:organic cation transporter protein-like [Ptychodera flava]|uniref:organic cation transporter protein-like n=1 Tax=Ptychodera flava TaxID=63121 RepID=UPI003969C5A5
MLKFDDILKYLGDFGPYQKKIYFLVCFVGFTTAMHAFSQVFLVAETDHWCYVPELAKYEANCTDKHSFDTCLETVKNFSIPLEDSSGGCDDTPVYSNCYRYDISDIDFTPGKDITKNTNTTIKCDHGWIYDRSQYKSTVFQEFDLVCDRYYLGALTSSMYMVGRLLGAVLFGALSDKIGRLPTLLITLILVCGPGVACAFSPNIIAFSAFRLIIGAAATGAFLVAFVIGTELVGPSKRVFAGLVIEFYFSAGYMVFAGLAYFIRHWWILQLVISAQFVILLLIYWLMLPESPRWLLSTGRTERAQKVIRKFEKGNHVVIPESVYDEMKANAKEDEKEAESQGRKEGFLDIIKSPTLRKRSLNLFFNWFTNSLVYYGLSLNTSNLAGDDYLNAFISAAVEIPAYAMGLYIVDTKLGRRWSLCGTMVVGGLACILTLFAPSCEMEWIGITLAMIGKFCITCSFGVIYIFSAEMYPTPVRTSGVGVCSMCARVGGILAPQILLLSTLWEPLAVVVFGACSISAGLLILLLPETRNIKLPETIEEAELVKRPTSRKRTEVGKMTGSEKVVGSSKERYLVQKTPEGKDDLHNGLENSTIDVTDERAVDAATQTSGL